MLLQDDTSIGISKGIYKINSRSRLCQATSKPLVLPCPNVIEWMTRRIDHESRTILNFKGKQVASFQAPVLNQISSSWSDSRMVVKQV